MAYNYKEMANQLKTSIPVIDISSLVTILDNVEDCSKTIQEIAKACLEYGFFYVVNHGIKESLQKAMFKNIQQFFELPQEKKDEIHKEKGGYRGYFGMKEEFSTETKLADWKEGIYYFHEFQISKHSPETIFSGKNPWPQKEYVPEFQPVVKEYFQRTTALGSTLMSGIALGLGLQKDFFKDKFNLDPFAQFAMFHYPPYQQTADGQNEVRWGVQEHTDYGVLTVLMQDDVGGLQVQTKDGRWIDAPPIANSFVINIGDALEIWTSGAYKAKLHKVRASQTHHRFSIATFYDPSLDCVINPIPLNNTIIPLECVKSDLSIKFPFTYGDYVLNKYQAFSTDSS